MKFKFKKILALAFLLMLGLQPLPGSAADTAFEEYQIKGALLFKLVSFVTWPPQENTDTTKNFTICILGENYFDDILNTIESYSSNGERINIKYYEQPSSLEENCQIAFISKSKKASLNSIFDSIEEFPILTVGDTENFLENGGMIKFQTNKGRLSIEINLDAVKTAQLRISAPLLQLANIVEIR